jgi:WD40 repeat protein
MTSRRISDPQNGERLIAVVPEPGAAEEGQRRRLNLFSGRALSDVALRAEQAHRATWLRRLAQLRSAGVVRGLEVSEEQPQTDEQAREKWLRVGAGLGLCGNGADVWLPRPLRVRFADLPRLTTPSEGTTPTTTSTTTTPGEEQRLWVLTLQPLSLLQADTPDPNRWSEWDDSGRAFEAETIRDGSRLGVVPLDLPLPEAVGGGLLTTLSGHQEGVWNIAWSPDGKALASTGADGILDIWDGTLLRTGQVMSQPQKRLDLQAEYKGRRFQCAMSWRPDGEKIAASSKDGVILIINPQREGDTLALKGHEGPVLSLSWSPDGSRLVSGDFFGTVRLWDAETGEMQAAIGGPRGIVGCVSWSPDGSRLAVGGGGESLEGSVRLLEATSGEEKAVLKGHAGMVFSLSWSPTGSRLASGGTEGTARIWDPERGEELSVLRHGEGEPVSVAWSPDGSRLATSGFDIRIWEAAKLTEERPLMVFRQAKHDGLIYYACGLSWSPDGTLLARGMSTRSGSDVEVWRLSTVEEQLRNGLAHALLAREREARLRGEMLPWERQGVPLALIALTADRQRIAFVDSAIVARPGGRPAAGSALLPDRLPSALAQARLRQFAEQVAELPPGGASTADEAERWLRSQMLPSFRHLPPFGLLPRAVMPNLTLQKPPVGLGREAFRAEMTTKDCLLFPDSWHVHLAPIPREQLELTMRDGVELAPFDLEQPDQVQVWVPVPQGCFEPDLLLEESVDPIFQSKIEAFRRQRDGLLHRRGWLRRRLAALSRARTGQAVGFATPDPGRLDDTEPEENESADAPDLDRDLIRYVDRSILLTSKPETATPDATKKTMLAVRFGTQRIQKGLLFYTPTRGDIDLCSVSEAVGVPTLAAKLTGWRKTWSVIVPGRFQNQNDKDDLFFYDRSQGEAEIYSIRDAEGLDRIYALTGLSRSWQLIIAGKFGGGSGIDDLLFYDPSAGVLEFFACGENGSLRSFKRITAWRKSWTSIIPGNFGGGGGLTDLLFYDQAAGEGEFYSLDTSGSLTLLQRCTGWRKSWNAILPGQFSGGNFTDLLFHDPEQGEAEFYRVNRGSTLSLLRRCWLPASPSSGFATGRFGNPPSNDGVFIDDPLGPPEDDYGTAYFISGLPRYAFIQSQLATQLAQSSPIDTDATALLTTLIDANQPDRGRRVLDAPTIEAIRTDLRSLSTPDKFSFDQGLAAGTWLLKINGVMTENERVLLKQKLAGSAYTAYFAPVEVQAAIDTLYKDSKDNNSLLALDPANSAFTGLEAFVQQLRLKTAQTDDSIEFGFLQVRTNMYRIREQVLGRDDALKLAISPTLAAIASRESARASQEELKSYFQRIKAERAAPKGDERASVTDATATDENGGITTLPDEPTAQAEGGRERAFSAGALLSQGSRVSMAAVSPTAIFTGPINTDASLFEPAAFERLDPLVQAPMEVVRQSPVIGRVVETISVADRLDQPPAIKVADFAINDQVSVLEGLGRQGLLKDLLVPGQEGLTFGKVRPGSITTPTVSGSTEAAYFSNAVRTLDLTVAALRLGEGRVEQYRQAIARCEETLRELRRLQGLLETRLRVVETSLAEARQDVSVAMALLEEETARVARVNARRRGILRDQVPFLAFQRPRTLRLRQASPWLPLDPGPSPDPLPPCLNDSPPIPREVRAMVNLLREAPLGWFNALLPELRRMDRIDTLVRLFDGAVLRRGVLATASLQPLDSGEEGDTPIGRTISRLFSERQQVLRQSWVELTPQAARAVAAQSWRESLAQAERILSLGDLLAGDHHRPELSNRAAALQDQWCRVAACLKDRFGAIEARLRLDWAERLSQFDGPVTLQVLTNLPRWGEVPDVRQRRALQSLVDWLFQQVNSGEPQALAFVNDLVRLSLLLACHAPVNQILSGQVIGTCSLAPEARLPIRMDPLRVRIGMPVLFHAASGVVAEGVVEDLGGDVATARIVRGDASRSADAQTRVQFLRQSPL